MKMLIVHYWRVSCRGIDVVLIIIIMDTELAHFQTNVIFLGQLARKYKSLPLTCAQKLEIYYLGNMTSGKYANPIRSKYNCMLLLGNI